jgi:hypothetical protein
MAPGTVTAWGECWAISLMPRSWYQPTSAAPGAAPEPLKAITSAPPRGA